ncbi:MAG: ferritin [Methanobacteriota archaeon]|nr:MAG: ferritin [Euryarchaeota archaeon]
MKLWRCQICGDPYLGEERPKNCPFCGAHERYMVLQSDFDNRIGKVEGLSETSKANLEAALELEIDNTRFYACAARKSAEDEARNLFKTLSKIESEHASVISKALGIPKPPIEEADICTGDYQKNLAESHRREERAIRRYGQFLSEAEEPRVQEIFSALVAIESDHLSLSEERMR